MSSYRLLSEPGHDAKTVKGEKQGYLTGILYLAPHTLAGVGNMCADATPGCIAGCLNTAGRGVFTQIQEARVRKTRWFHSDRAGFMAQLVKDIQTLIREAKRKGFIPAVRLNGTSDLPWENIAADRDVRQNLMYQFPDVQFYDYTKSFSRAMHHATKSGRIPANYHLTFSRSECNDVAAEQILKAGGNVAVVFSTRKGEALPEYWNDYTVIKGDTSDLRFLDRNNWVGLVSGLYAKGKARKDTSGFVVTV